MATLSKNFARQGVAVVPGVIDSDTCVDLLSTVREVSGAGSRTLLDSASIRDVARRLRNDEGLGDLLGGLVAVQCTAFVKTAERNWAVRLHRDRVIPVHGQGCWASAGLKEGMHCVRPPLQFLQRFVAVRLSLDGAPEGDLQVVPGSHADSRMPVRSEAQPVPVPQGGVLLMKPLLAHASTKLREVASRHVLHYLFAPLRLPSDYRWYYAV